MVKFGKGGANTQTGLIFEGDCDLATFLNKQENYKTKKYKDICGTTDDAYKLYFKNKEVAIILKKHAIYRFLEKEYNINYKDTISKKLLPDDSIFILKNNTFFIIEIKSQNTFGSVDEKLQTCDFKKKQWQKILAFLNCKVEYFYLLNDWFKKPEYKDTLDYIISVNCRYFFEYIPLSELGLEVK